MGQHDEAIAVCRAGLAVHPGYASARLTLGRALLHIGDYDGAEQELARVLYAAPDNLAAIRALGEVHEKRGALASSLAQYEAALTLAPNDPELEQTVRDLSARLAEHPAADPAAGAALAALERLLTAIHVTRAERRT